MNHADIDECSLFSVIRGVTILMVDSTAFVRKDMRDVFLYLASYIDHA